MSAHCATHIVHLSILLDPPENTFLVYDHMDEGNWPFNAELMRGIWRSIKHRKHRLGHELMPNGALNMHGLGIFEMELIGHALVDYRDDESFLLKSVRWPGPRPPWPMKPTPEGVSQRVYWKFKHRGTQPSYSEILAFAREFSTLVEEKLTVRPFSAKNLEELHVQEVPEEFAVYDIRTVVYFNGRPFLRGPYHAVRRYLARFRRGHIRRHHPWIFRLIAYVQYLREEDRNGNPG